MVVRTNGERRGPAFLPARLVRGVTSSIVHGLTVFDAAERSRRNALAASVEITTACAERRRVDAFLADYASAGARAPKRPA
ncbi:hypothetical protein [Solicola gregarius]|uniref:Uncharacterized protein n=1 Tax=Solicola gregarius TaxID=2908642 RepID=A0AA46TFK3_9ACTN|nr:hypothetical protein [Solicola gregarius]UYM04278.1 hypothetical protein L0C25_17270 [Solicola gregarius]